MRLAVRKIFHKAATPSCDIIDLDAETWMKFLHGDIMTRKKIVCKVTGDESMIYYIKDIAWIPLEDQDLLVETHKIS